MSVPEAGRLLGIGRDAAYRAAARGEIPTLKLGRRLVVPLGELHRLVGLPSERPAILTGGSPQDESLEEVAPEQKDALIELQLDEG